MHLRSIVFLFVALVAGLLPVTSSAQTPRPADQELTSARAAGKDWITYGGSVFNQRYSTLTQLDPSNVGQLKGAWLTRLGSGRGSKYYFEADPIVIDGIMYTSGQPGTVVALDAKNGRQIWNC